MAQNLNRDHDRPLFNAGIKEGEQRTRVKVLTYLQSKYMNPELDTSTPQAKAIIELAKELSEYLSK